jgi:hypothetical protein
MKKYKVTLSDEERTNLETIVSKGSHKSQKVLNALILLNSNEIEGAIKQVTNKYHKYCM